MDVRIYTPKGDGPFPVILYIHGGGWVIADLDTYDSSPGALCNAAQAIVVSTHYRLAPEHPFPAAHEDVFAIYQWVMKNEEKRNYDAKRLAVVGESAGGDMAAAISLMAKARGVTLPIHQVLVYPVTDPGIANSPSYLDNAEAKPLNKAMMEWFVRHTVAKHRGWPTHGSRCCRLAMLSRRCRRPQSSSRKSTRCDPKVKNS